MATTLKTFPATDTTSVINMVVGERYRIIHQIGSGAFGQVYIARCCVTGEHVAVKLENIQNHPIVLWCERRAYSALQGAPGFPSVKWFGRDEDEKWNVLVLDLLGASLQDLFEMCGKCFSIKTVLLLADQMISRLEYVHSRNYVHRDVKPENFMMGLGPNIKRVYLIDFGLSKLYRNHRYTHIFPSSNKTLTGSARYASLNSHNGLELSRRDDMESLAYILIFFCRGCLPWQDLKAETTKEKYEKIAEKKRNTSVGELCRELPEEFAQFLNYCRNLKFDEVPNYKYLHHLVWSLFSRLHLQNDFIFDWTPVYEKSQQLLKERI